MKREISHPVHGSRGWLAAMLLMATAALAGCAGSYAGIPLGYGRADSELQALARLAAADDKRAQFELGLRYEKGIGVPADQRRAKEQYRLAARETALAAVYSIPGPRGGAITGVHSSGANSRRLPGAIIRYCALAFVDAPTSEIDCASFTGLAEATLLVSYELSYRSCAQQASFTIENVSAFAEVRECIVSAAEFIDCEAETANALAKAALLASREPRLSWMQQPLAQLKAVCGLATEEPREPASTDLAASTALLTPLDAVDELRRGVVRPVLELYPALRFILLFCRDARGFQPYTLPRLENTMCDLTLGRNSRS